MSAQLRFGWSFLLLTLLACRPTTPVPERIELSPSSLSLQFGEEQLVTARVFSGSKPTSLEGLSWSSSDDAVVSVIATEAGTVTVRGLNAGTAMVTAQVREATATLEVTVAPRIVTLTRLELTPAAPVLARGLRLQLQATGLYDDGSTRDLTTSVAWASADSTRATVTSAGLVSARGVGEVELRAIKAGVTGRVTLTVTSASISSVEVRPAQLSLPRGTSGRLTATARLSDSTTNDVTSQVTWSSSDDTLVSVDATGRLTTHLEGTATLTAVLGELSGTSTVTVTSAVLRVLEVTPAAPSLPLGSTQQLTVSGHFSDGSQQDVTAQASWRSGTLAVATVSSTGLVSAMGLGLSVVTATVAGISANASVICTAAQLQAIHLAPQGSSLALGLTRTFTATGVYTDASTRDLTSQLTWSSSDAAVASVGNTAGQAGVVRANAEGTTTLAATNGTLSGSATLTVTPASLVSLQVTPPTASVPMGLTLQLHAGGTYSDGSQRDLTAQVSWSSSADPLATVSNAVGTEGLLTAVARGTATLTATSGALSSAMFVEVVAPVLQRIDVSAPANSLAKGRNQQLTATGVYSDGSMQDLTSQVTWAPASGTVLSVSTAGLLTALLEGTSTVTATLGSASGTASFSVTPAELDLLTVSPAAPTLALGLTQALTALGTYSDGSTQPLSTGLTWSSADAGVATVSSQGLVASVAQGEVDITASLGARSGSAHLTVTAPALVSITVTPATATLDKTQTQQLSADGLYTDGSHVDLTATAAWQSSAGAVASVSATGEVTALTPGTATVSATQAGVVGSALVTVNRPALQSLTVTPASANVDVRATLAFSALATYVDASTEVVTGLVSWSSSDVALATIDAVTGIATGVAEGAVTITAQWGSVSGTAQLAVNPAVLVSLVVSGRSKVAAGSSVALVATGTFSDGSTSDVTGLATWVSDAPAIARLTNLAGVRGVVEGLSAGSTAVHASVGAVSGAAFGVQVLDTNAPYAGRCGPGLVISQLYGGGGNGGAPLRNDFIELHNPTASGVSLNGLSVQYASSAGTTWTSLALANVTLPAGSYYLVQFGSGGAAGTVLPNVDQTSALNISATAGKAALVNGTAALSGACPTAGLLDLVGFGSGTSCSEGTLGPAGSNTASIIRGVSGCRDGNQNGTDFTVASTITPRHLGTPPLSCSCFVNGTAAPEELDACLLQAPASLSAVAGEVSAAIPALVTQPGVTDSAGFNASLQVQVGFGPSGVNPTSAAGWRWWPGVGRTPGVVSDGYDGVFVAPGSGSHGFTARASRDGVNWTACDLNGAGSGSGLAFELGQLGLMTVP